MRNDATPADPLSGCCGWLAVMRRNSHLQRRTHAATAYDVVRLEE